MMIAAYLLSFLCLLLAGCLFVRLNPPYNFYFFMFQMVAGGLTPFLAILGGIGAILGWLSHALAAFWAGILGSAIRLLYCVGHCTSTGLRDGLRRGMGDQDSHLPSVSLAPKALAAWTASK